MCFADGTEAIVGVKAEVEKSQWRPAAREHGLRLGDMEVDDEDQNEDGTPKRKAPTLLRKGETLGKKP